MSSRKISNRFAIILIAAAAAFDALSLVPGISEFVAIIGQIVMGCLFYAAGVSVFRHKQAVMFLSATILEAIPVASALPFFLVETLTIIGISRAGKA